MIAMQDSKKVSESSELRQKDDTVVQMSVTATPSSKILLHTKEAGDPYDAGDVYDAVPLAIFGEWEINSVNYPYLKFIKSISAAWPHLRYLADFMEVSTIPLKWEVIRNNEAERRERAQRTNVSILDFPRAGGAVKQTRVTSFDKLELSIEEMPSAQPPNRLILVEDLSRRVIETLGAKFDIDPNFFRGHIDDYSWYNIRDRWMDPPNLTSSMQRQKWIRLRFVRPRYFRTSDMLQKAREESAWFNIYRRPEDDLNRWAEIDGEGVVGLTRTKVSIWMGNSGDQVRPGTGIMLIDPTVKEGFPMWYGYCNWAPIPSIHDQPQVPPSGPPRTSLFEDLNYWIKNRPESQLPSNDSRLDPVMAALEPTLSLICGEWLIMCEYIKTRLGQIEWQLGYPERFRVDSDLIHTALSRVHTWRRLFPLYKEMVSETLSSTVAIASASGYDAVGSSSSHCLDNFRTDLGDILKRLAELERRNEKIMGAVATVISIEDTHIGLRENRNMGRLTWLATVFLPLTYITGLFSMQTDVTALRTTFYWYFGIAVPVTAIALLVAVYYSYSERTKRITPLREWLVSTRGSKGRDRTGC